MIGVKTCLLPTNTHKICKKAQHSFAHYLTSACPGRPSSRTANSSGQLLMSSSMTRRRATESSLKICLPLRHKTMLTCSFAGEHCSLRKTKPLSESFSIPCRRDSNLCFESITEIYVGCIANISADFFHKIIRVR